MTPPTDQDNDVTLDDIPAFGDVEEALTMTTRGREIIKFLAWLTDNPSGDAIVLAAGGDMILRQLTTVQEFAQLVALYDNWEVDLAVAPGQCAG